MTPQRILAALVLASSLALLPACGGTESDLAASADALDLAPCFGIISELRADTGLVRLGDKDRTGLVTKLDNAAAKLQLGKTADAVQKLGDYTTQIQKLVAGGKIGPSADGAVTAQTLLDGAAMAVACIQPPVF